MLAVSPDLDGLVGEEMGLQFRGRLGYLTVQLPLPPGADRSAKKVRTLSRKHQETIAPLKNGARSVLFH